ncbi:MAG: hypothetical protein KAS47_09430, partial [Candidatus Heimdallarchaeota archaeon]|nr:hypothetical protein [Candidatus Heimdallarchaeota archaeon]
MDTSNDIVKHLFYSAWTMVLLQTIITVSSTLLGPSYPNLPLILSVAFDCVIVLFAIGILRAGRENQELKLWLPSSLAFLVSATADIIVVILYYSLGREQIWDLSPVIFVRLALLIVFNVSLVAAFTLNKFFFDDLLDKNDINRKSDFLVPIGFLVLFIPSVLSWYSVYVSPQLLPNWLQTAAFVIFLFAQFAIILGLFQLTSTLNLLRRKNVQRQEKS